MMYAQHDCSIKSIDSPGLAGTGDGKSRKLERLYDVIDLQWLIILFSQKGGRRRNDV
jgi:hypothetical protein